MDGKSSLLITRVGDRLKGIIITIIIFIIIIELIVSSIQLSQRENPFLSDRYIINYIKNKKFYRVLNNKTLILCCLL